MATKNVTMSLWEQLPRAERDKLTKELLVRNEKPAEKNGKNGRGGFQLKGYVRCELSKTEKEAFLAWEEQVANVECYGRLIAMADSGYLLKVGESGQGFQASLCASSTGQPWDGYVLTAHARHASRAVVLLVYKHEVLLESDWSSSLQEEDEDFVR